MHRITWIGYVHYVHVLYGNIFLFHYYTISQQVVAFPLPGMQEITAHGSIVRRDQSDVQNRINVRESRGMGDRADQKLMHMYGIFDGFA